MATEKWPYVDDVGTDIEIDMDADISLATAITLEVFKPDSTIVTLTGITIVGTTKFKYTIIAGDFNKIGIYAIQPHFTLGQWTGRGRTVKVQVYSRFD